MILKYKSILRGAALLLSLALLAVAPAAVAPPARASGHDHEYECNTYPTTCECKGGHTGEKTCTLCVCATCRWRGKPECAGCNCGG